MLYKETKIYIGDENTKIRLYCGLDITDATSVKIKVLTPSDEQKEWDAVVVDTMYIEGTSDSQEKGYHEFGLNVLETDDTGLLIDTIYKFIINGIEYELDTTGFTSPILYSTLITSLDSMLVDFSVTFETNDIRITANEFEVDVTMSMHDVKLDTDNLLYDDLGILELPEPVEAYLGWFDHFGQYFLQAYIETPTWKGRGETTIIEVSQRFK